MPNETVKFFRNITAIMEEVNTVDVMCLNFQENFYEVFNLIFLA